MAKFPRARAVALVLGLAMASAVQAQTITGSFGVNTGTSGHAIPYLDGTNIWSAIQTLTINQNSATVFSINNNSAGGSAVAGLRVTNGTTIGGFQLGGTGYTDLAILQNSTYLYSFGGPALIDASGAGNPVILATGDIERCRALLGFMCGTTTDPGVGIVNVLNGYRVGNAALAIGHLASIAANTIVGQTASGAPAALAINGGAPCTNALTWVNGTGFGCNVSAGTGTVTSVSAGDATVTLTPSPIVSAGTIKVNLGNPNTWTATQKFGSALFGTTPWADVTSGLNGCNAAVGDGVTDNSAGGAAAAVQCQINYLYGRSPSGGIVFFPCGNFYVSAGVVNKGTIRLVGAARDCAILTTNAIDNPVVSFDATSNYASIEHMFIIGVASGGTRGAVEIAANVPVNLKDCHIVGESDGLRTAGVDGHVDNCFIAAMNGGNAMINSTGANWYREVKLDLSGASTTTYGFEQTGGTGLENSLDQVDISAGAGTFTYSLYVNGTGAKTQVSNSTLSSPVGLIAGSWTAFSTTKFGSTTLGSNFPLSLGISYAFSSTTVTGPGTRNCSANTNITC